MNTKNNVVLGALDIETLSLPDECISYEKRIAFCPIMTNFAMAFASKSHKLPIVVLGVTDVEKLLSDNICAVNSGVLDWWKTSDNISEAVRDNQINHIWQSKDTRAAIFIPSKDKLAYESHIELTGLDLSRSSTPNLTDTILDTIEVTFNVDTKNKEYFHIVGNGSEFDMSIYNVYFKPFPMRCVGSARSFTFIMNNLQKADLADNIAKVSEDIAREVTGNLYTYLVNKNDPSNKTPTNLLTYFVNTYGVLPAWHSPLMDALSELYSVQLTLNKIFTK